jgi:hypothetical protein
VRESGWRQELASVVQFCAWRKPTRVIWRFGFSGTALLP